MTGGSNVIPEGWWTLLLIFFQFSILFILKIGCFKSDATDDSEKKDIRFVHLNEALYFITGRINSQKVKTKL
jgi:hypothetical protein